MTAFVERLVQKIADSAPIETTVSNIVAGVLESTAARLARYEPSADNEDAEVSDEVA